MTKWAQLTTAALVALGLFAFVTLKGIDACRAQTAIDRQANYDAQEQRNEAAGAIERACAGLPASKRTACQNRTRQPYEEAQRDIRDLEAQEVSALWNRVIGQNAIVGMAVGVVGLILVFTTFWETRKGNLIQLAAQRPWVTLEVRPVSTMREPTGYMHFRINAVTKNVGQRPATHFSCCSKLMFFGESDNYPEMKPKLMEQLEVWYAHLRPPAGSILAPNGTQESPHWASFSQSDMNVTKVVGINVAIPVILTAVFYRSETEPELLQLVWSAVRVVSINPQGDEITMLYLDRESLATDLGVTPITGTRHEKRRARKYNDTQDTA